MASNSLRVTIDTDACVGSGQCVLAAANVFDQRDKDGVVVLLQAAPPAEAYGAVREAETLCPASAIRITE